MFQNLWILHITIDFIDRPDKLIGKWAQEYFHNSNPIHLEIGSERVTS